MKKITKNSLGGEALILTASKFITLFIALIITMLLSRFLSLEEYGTYSQILLVVNLMTALLMLGLPNSINYFLARAETDDERKKFLSIYYSFSTVLSIIVGLVLVVSISVIVDFFDNELLRCFMYILAVYPWTKIIMSSIENVLIVYRKTSLIIWFRLANSTFLLGIILLVSLLDLNFRSYMFLFILVETLFTISIYLIVKHISGGIVISFDKQLIKTVLVFSIPIGLASAVGTLNIQLDKLMIGKYFDTEQMAIYTNASREMPVAIIAVSLTAVLLPKLAVLLKKGEDRKAIDLWGNSMVLSYIFICFFVSAFFTFAPDVMNLLYSEKYIEGVPIFRIYAIVLLLKFTYFGMILNSKGRTTFIFYSSIIALVINVILNYILLRSIGIQGPAIATFLSQLIINIIQLIFTSRILGVKFSKLLPWKKIGVITVVNFFLGSIFFSLKSFIALEVIIGELLETILLGVLWAALYVIICIKELKKQWKKLNDND